jgi:hypothetical protein
VTKEQKVMLDAKDIMKFTGIGMDIAYGLLHSKQFHVVQIGSKLLVHEEVFQRWLKGENTSQKSRR